MDQPRERKTTAIVRVGGTLCQPLSSLRGKATGFGDERAPAAEAYWDLRDSMQHRCKTANLYVMYREACASMAENVRTG